VIIEPQPISNPNSIGRAIVIAASGSHSQNTLFPISEELSRKIYRTLNQRGYNHEDITYLNPKTWQDINGDGTDDKVVDDALADPAAALESAFNATSTLQAGQQFIFYLHGHGQIDQLKITREYWLSATELRRLMDKVPEQVEQIVIIDSCYSGSFIDDLSQANRIILTSSEAEDTAWNTRFENFSATLINNLRHGKDLRTAFQATEDLMISNPNIFGSQRPQLDADGDGVANSSRDKTAIANLFLGKEGVVADSAAEIIDIHPPISLDSEQTEGTLWIKTSPSGDNIRRVRAILIPPNTQSTDYQGENTNFEREEIDMFYNDGRYITLHTFSQAGIWRILYQAQGTDGSWSDNAFGEVQASDAKTITARMNQSTYQIGENISFKLDLNENPNQLIPYDIYAALIFPQGYFMTITHPLTFNLPGTIQAYRQNITGSQTFPIFNLELPQGLTLGIYNGCGIITSAGNDPWQMENWIDWHCQTFELY
ncbi:MAG: hypothetical protein KAH84_05745, partial [Thiomargarita sp.]|nr:hypothetical protein [Thiomargarita sp.]